MFAPHYTTLVLKLLNSIQETINAVITLVN